MYVGNRAGGSNDNWETVGSTNMHSTFHGNSTPTKSRRKYPFRVFPRSAPRVISAQNLILTHNHPAFRALGRTRGAQIYLPLGPYAISPLTKMQSICHAGPNANPADLFPRCRDHFVRNATRLPRSEFPFYARRYSATDSVSNHPSI